MSVVLTGLLLFVGFLGTGQAAANQHLEAPPLAYGLMVAAALPVLLWRVRPLWTFVLTNLATLTSLALGFAYGPILFASMVAIFGLARHTPPRRSLTAIGALILATFLVMGLGIAQGERRPAELLTIAPWLLLPAAFGMILKVRRDATADIRSAQARRAVSEERLRLAQEVHDVAGHGFAVIAMQAGVALRVLDRDPAAARQALEGIRAASKDALDGLRAEVEALRQDVPLRPTTSLADLPALAGRIRASGLPITLVAPAVGPVPTDVSQAAYRIIQESLTNVLRHAGPDATARISVHIEDGDLLVSIEDSGRGGPVAPDGRGIDGMRLRATALGGTLEARPSPDGFTVRARLPLRGVSQP